MREALVNLMREVHSNHDYVVILSISILFSTSKRYTFVLYVLLLAYLAWFYFRMLTSLVNLITAITVSTSFLCISLYFFIFLCISCISLYLFVSLCISLYSLYFLLSLCLRLSPLLAFAFEKIKKLAHYLFSSEINYITVGGSLDLLVSLYILFVLIIFYLKKPLCSS